MVYDHTYHSLSRVLSCDLPTSGSVGCVRTYIGHNVMYVCSADASTHTATPTYVLATRALQSWGVYLPTDSERRAMDHVQITSCSCVGVGAATRLHLIDLAQCCFSDIG